MTQTARRLIEKIDSISDPWQTALRNGAKNMPISHTRDWVIRLANDAEALANFVSCLNIALSDYLPLTESSEIMGLLSRVERLEQENRSLHEKYDEVYSKLSMSQQKDVNGWED